MEFGLWAINKVLWPPEPVKYLTTLHVSLGLIQWYSYYDLVTQYFSDSLRADPVKFVQLIYYIPLIFHLPLTLSIVIGFYRDSAIILQWSSGFFILEAILSTITQSLNKSILQILIRENYKELELSIVNVLVLAYLVLIFRRAKKLVDAYYIEPVYSRRPEFRSFKDEKGNNQNYENCSYFCE